MNTRLTTGGAETMQILDTFRGISLPELEQQAELLKRMDRKYVVTGRVLLTVLEQLQNDFSILDIEGRRSFQYDNCYFDDPGFSNYWHHQQNRRLRFKARTRHYLDSDACFVELKLKGQRGLTIKRRLPYDSAKVELLDSEAHEFIRAACQECYSRPLEADLGPILRVRFERITLVANTGNERITIDRRLQFSSGNDVYMLNPDLAIIETKSAGKRGLADRILRSLHQHPARACSKYCIGLALLGKVTRYNRFLRAMRLLGAMPLKTGIAAANADTLEQEGNSYEVFHVANQN